MHNSIITGTLQNAYGRVPCKDTYQYLANEKKFQFILPLPPAHPPHAPRDHSPLLR